MRDATMKGLAMPFGEQVAGDAERKLATFDVGVAAAVSVGLMMMARVVNVMAW